MRSYWKVNDGRTRVSLFAVQIRHRRFAQHAAVGGEIGQIFRLSRLMHHAHAGNNGEVVAVEIEVDLIWTKPPRGVAAAVCLRLHDLAVNAGDRRLAERPLGFAGAGVETGAQIVAACGFASAVCRPRVGIVVRVHRLHFAGDAVRHISPVMGFGMLVVDFVETLSR